MNDMHKFAILVYTDRVVQLSVTHLINFNLQAANHKFAINAMGCFQLKWNTDAILLWYKLQKLKTNNNLFTWH